MVYFSGQKSRVGGCTRSRLARGVDVCENVCVCVACVCEHVARAAIAWFTICVLFVVGCL